MFLVATLTVFWNAGDAGMAIIPAALDGFGRLAARIAALVDR